MHHLINAWWYRGLLISEKVSLMGCKEKNNSNIDIIIYPERNHDKISPINMRSSTIWQRLNAGKGEKRNIRGDVDVSHLSELTQQVVLSWQRVGAIPTEIAVQLHTAQFWTVLACSTRLIVELVTGGAADWSSRSVGWNGCRISVAPCADFTEYDTCLQIKIAYRVNWSEGTIIHLQCQAPMTVHGHVEHSLLVPSPG